MKSFNSSFLTHIQGEVTTLATCYKITRKDGVVIGFTSFDENIVIDGVTYLASTGFTQSTFEETSDLRVNNLDIQGIISSPDIIEDDLLSGKYSQASCDIFIVNYKNLPASLSDKTLLKWVSSGFLGEVRLTDRQFVVEFRSLSQLLSVNQLELYSPRCRVKRFGNSLCKKSLTSFTFSYTVASVVSSTSFTHSSTAQADGYFQNGIIKFTSGPNDDLELTCKTYKSGVITLVEPPYFPIAIGHTFRAIRGCDRKFETCRDTYNNVKNFRGEPNSLLPGIDTIAKVQR
jgi:uncharacterized phage protein (TIGR02218 family)